MQVKSGEEKRLWEKYKRGEITKAELDKRLAALHETTTPEQRKKQRRQQRIRQTRQQRMWGMRKWGHPDNPAERLKERKKKHRGTKWLIWHWQYALKNERVRRILTALREKPATSLSELARRANVSRATLRIYLGMRHKTRRGQRRVMLLGLVHVMLCSPEPTEKHQRYIIELTPVGYEIARMKNPSYTRLAVAALKHGAPPTITLQLGSYISHRPLPPCLWLVHKWALAMINETAMKICKTLSEHPGVSLYTLSKLTGIPRTTLRGYLGMDTSHKHTLIHLVEVTRQGNGKLSIQLTPIGAEVYRWYTLGWHTSKPHRLFHALASLAIQYYCQTRKCDNKNGDALSGENAHDDKTSGIDQNPALPDKPTREKNAAPCRVHDKKYTSLKKEKRRPKDQNKGRSYANASDSTRVTSNGGEEKGLRGDSSHGSRAKGYDGVRNTSCKGRHTGTAYHDKHMTTTSDGDDNGSKEGRLDTRAGIAADALHPSLSLGEKKVFEGEKTRVAGGIAANALHPSNDGGVETGGVGGGDGQTLLGNDNAIGVCEPTGEGTRTSPRFVKPDACFVKRENGEEEAKNLANSHRKVFGAKRRYKKPRWYYHKYEEKQRVRRPVMPWVFRRPPFKDEQERVKRGYIDPLVDGENLEAYKDMPWMTEPYDGLGWLISTRCGAHMRRCDYEFLHYMLRESGFLRQDVILLFCHIWDLFGDLRGKQEFVWWLMAEVAKARGGFVLPRGWHTAVFFHGGFGLWRYIDIAFPAPPIGAKHRFFLPRRGTPKRPISDVLEGKRGKGGKLAWHPLFRRFLRIVSHACGRIPAEHMPIVARIAKKYLVKLGIPLSAFPSIIDAAKRCVPYELWRKRRRDDDYDDRPLPNPPPLLVLKACIYKFKPVLEQYPQLSEREFRSLLNEVVMLWEYEVGLTNTIPRFSPILAAVVERRRS